MNGFASRDPTVRMLRRTGVSCREVVAALAHLMDELAYSNARIYGRRSSV